jgi:hypothetical protein
MVREGEGGGSLNEFPPNFPHVPRQKGGLEPF